MLIRRELSTACRQLMPALFGALITVSFGMALGWPCVAFPQLLKDEASPIRITLAESAMIAGLLMEGNAIGALFSGCELLPARVSLSVCASIQICGWLAMYYSTSLYWLLASRFFVGLGNGCGVGQLKRYILATCSLKLAEKISTMLPLSVNLGLAVIFAYGAFVDFRTLALCAIIPPSICLVAIALIPQLQPPKSVSHCVTVSKEISIPVGQPAPVQAMSAFEVIRDRKARNSLLMLFLTIFVQQYSGGPALLVYTQIIFASTSNRYPKLCSILYALAAFVSMLLALIYAKSIRRKTNLLLSNIVCIICHSLLALYFFFHQQVLDTSEVLTWMPLLLTILFNFFHTFSFGMLPILQLKENVPKRAVKVLSIFSVVHFSLSAVLSTKIFQVIFETFGFGMAFLFFICVLFLNLLISMFIRDTTPKGKLKINPPTAV